MLVAVAGVAAGGVDGSLASAQEETDDDPPELTGGERINDTTIRVTFTDDSGVDTGSIGADEFFLGTGDLDSVSVRGTGPTASVDLHLADPVDSPDVTVAVRDGSDIQDVDGNPINTSEFVGVTVSGMDAVPPELRRMEVPERVSDAAELRFSFAEPVEKLRVTISGPREAVFNRDDFDRVGDNEYALEHELPTDGVYTVELHNATDAAGNTATFGRATSLEVRSADVRAIAGVDFSASDGLNLTFDATQSSDAAVAYLWDFGDGETATGQRVSHEFAPGNYTIGLEVIDEFGNTGRDEVVLSLSGNTTAVAPGSQTGDGPAVTVDRSGSPRPSRAHLSIGDVTAGERIDVGSGGLTDRSLVATEAFSLDRVGLTPAGERPIGIGLTAVGPESSPAADAARAVDADPIGGFLARPTVPDEAFSSLAVRFTVSTGELRRLGTAASSVGLYREQGGSWEPLSTTVRSLTEAGASFESELPGFSRFAILSTAVDADSSGSGTDGDDGTDGSENSVGNDTGGESPIGPDNGTGSGTGSVDSGAGSDGSGNSTAADTGQFRVTNVTLSETSISVGDVVEVQAIVANEGEEPGDFLAALERNGTVVGTQEVLRIPPDGERLPVRFTRQLNETGTVEFSINGTEAPELSVEDGGGGLFGFLSVLPVPIGLLRPALLFVGGPLLLIYVVLKVIARLR